MSEVEYQVRDGIAVLTMTRGRANALAPSLRAALDEALSQAASAEDVEAVVLRGGGEVFSSGVDIAEYDAPLAKPWIDALTLRIEEFPKPVVAALNGAALGAGFELALAAHGRVVQRNARLAQPEVTLSLVPGGGATQRLPRLLGAQAALEIMLAGRAVGPEDPRLRRLFDQITDEDPLDAALALAARLARAGRWPRACDAQRGFSDPEGYQRAVTAVADRLRDRTSAEADVLRCVEAAQLLPFPQGMAFEQTVFEERIASPEARAIRHVYTAERRAALHPEAQGAQPRPIRRVALLGEDPQLAQIAILCLDLGHEVSFAAGSAEGQALIARVHAVYEAAVNRGRLKPEARNAVLARLSHTDAQTALSQADLILEGSGHAAPQAEPAPGAIWCVLDDPARAAARGRQLGQPVMALRLYAPAHSSRMAEFACHEDTPAEMQASLIACFVSQGRVLLRAPARPGMLGQRAVVPWLCAALTLVRAGVSPFEIDKVSRLMGFQTGPLRLLEGAGAAQLAASLQEIRGEAAEPDLAFLRALQARGAGFYRAEGTDGAMVPDPEALAWLASWRQQNAAGIARPPADVALETALLAAMVNGAARMIAEGEVLRASDIDLCFVRGYGMARERGGPLLQADIIGLLPLVRAMKKLAPLSDSLWSPQPLVEEMVKYGRRFF